MIKTTSKQALAVLEQTGKAGIQRAKILKFMQNHPRKIGWTRQELSQRLLMPINVICGRVNDLIDAGLEVDDKRPCMVTKSKVEVLRVVI